MRPCNLRRGPHVADGARDWSGVPVRRPMTPARAVRRRRRLRCALALWGALGGGGGEVQVTGGGGAASSSGVTTSAGSGGGQGGCSADCVACCNDPAC